MELTDLKMFAAIAEEGSISRAAERLGYVQSNVTARIRKLESELGVPLFHRHPKGVVLTEKGSAFRDYALTILNLSEEAVRAVRETDYPSGPLAVGVVETVNCRKLMKALADFQTRYPGVSLSITTGTSADLLAKLLNHQLDGTFVTGELHSSKLVFEHTVKDELRLLTRTSGETYPDLARAKWAVSPKGCPFRAVLEAWLRSEGISLENMLEVSSLETLLSCVRSGLAATLLPQSVLSGEFEELGSYPVPEPFRYTTTSFVRRNDGFSSKACAAFVEMVKVNGL